MATKPEFLVAKEKMLVMLVTVSVAISSPAILEVVKTSETVSNSPIQDYNHPDSTWLLCIVK